MSFHKVQRCKLVRSKSEWKSWKLMVALDWAILHIVLSNCVLPKDSRLQIYKCICWNWMATHLLMYCYRQWRPLGHLLRLTLSYHLCSHWDFYIILAAISTLSLKFFFRKFSHRSRIDNIPKLQKKKDFKYDIAMYIFLTQASFLLHIIWKETAGGLNPSFPDVSINIDIYVVGSKL